MLSWVVFSVCFGVFFGRVIILKVVSWIFIWCRLLVVWCMCLVWIFLWSILSCNVGLVVFIVNLMVWYFVLFKVVVICLLMSLVLVLYVNGMFICVWYSGVNFLSYWGLLVKRLFEKCMWDRGLRVVFWVIFSIVWRGSFWWTFRVCLLGNNWLSDEM